VLRITTTHTSGGTTFVVEGKLAGPCVNELEKCWRAATDESQTAILIDLSSVTFIDTSGKRLLALIYKTGARFVTAGLIAKSVVEEIQSTEL
jgi:anti-anti-sigma regulatory factor